jgi:hypothetical protein
MNERLTIEEFKGFLIDDWKGYDFINFTCSGKVIVTIRLGCELNEGELGLLYEKYLLNYELP